MKQDTDKVTTDTLTESCLQSGRKVSDDKFPVNFKGFQSSEVEKIFCVSYLGITDKC